MVSRCILLCVACHSQLFEQLQGEEGSRLLVKLLWHIFFGRGESGDRVPQVSGLPSWNDAFYIPNAVPKQIKTPSSFLTNSSLKLIWFIHSTFPGEETLQRKERRPIWTLLSRWVLLQWTSAASMETLRGTCQERTRFKTSWSMMMPACELAGEERCPTSGLGGLQRRSIWKSHTPQSRAYRNLVIDCLLTRKHCVLQCGRNAAECNSSDSSPRFFMIATVEEGASLFLCPGSQF